MTSLAESAANPYLTGNYAPVRDELDVSGLGVAGQLPPGLVGTYLRVGPNPRFEPLGAYHLFDGDGMVHALTIEDGDVRYRNRWVRTKAFGVEERLGRAVFGGLAELRVPPPEVVAEAGPARNAANTNVVSHGGRLLALWEAGLPYELTTELDTVGEYDFGGAYTGAFSAHPHVDPVTGEMFVFGYAPFPPYLRYHVISPTGEVVSSTVIDIPAPVMMHDFVITEHHAVFLDAPAIFDVQGALAGEPIVKWSPEAGCRVGVMARYGDGGEITWHDVEPRYVFHFMNAYEDDGRLHVLAEQMPELRFGIEGDDPAAAPEFSLWDWSIDLAGGTLTETQLDDRRTGFPRIDERSTGRRSRHGHALTFAGTPRQGDFDAVVRYDLATMEAETHAYGAGRTTSEVVFAPDPAAASDSEGWLCSFVHDAATDTSTFEVLDAADVTAGPLAVVTLPRRVPFGFHAAWLPAG